MLHIRDKSRRGFRCAIGTQQRPLCSLDENSVPTLKSVLKSAETAFSPPHKRFRIALADDEYELRSFFAKVIPHFGFDLVALAASGEELIQLSHQSKPDLVVTDVHLPDISGPEAIETIRRTRWVAAVYVTENPREDLAALRARYAAILMKPFRMTDLAPTFQYAMNLRPVNAELRSESECQSNQTEVKHDGST